MTLAVQLQTGALPRTIDGHNHNKEACSKALHLPDPALQTQWSLAPVASPQHAPLIRNGGLASLAARDFRTPSRTLPFPALWLCLPTRASALSQEVVPTRTDRLAMNPRPRRHFSMPRRRPGGAGRAPHRDDPDPARQGEAREEVPAAGAPAAAGASDTRVSQANFSPFDFDPLWRGKPRVLGHGRTIFLVCRAAGVLQGDLFLVDYNGSQPRGQPFLGVDGKEMIFPYTWMPLFSPKWTGQPDPRRGHQHFWHNWETNEKRVAPAVPYIPPPMRPSTLGRYAEECRCPIRPCSPGLRHCPWRWYPNGKCVPEIDADLSGLPELLCESEHTRKGEGDYQWKHTMPRSYEDALAGDPELAARSRRIIARANLLAKLGMSPPAKTNRLRENYRHGCFVFPNQATSFVRRRALIVACTLKGNTKYPQMQLPDLPKDAAAIYSMLLEKEFQPEDIVILTDDMDHRSWKRARGDEVLFQHSNSLNIATSMGRLVSGLVNTPDNVANSLFFYAAGHGSCTIQSILPFETTNLRQLLCRKK